jgi:hypothetical protein
VHNEASEEQFVSIFSVEIMEIKGKVFISVVIRREFHMLIRHGIP